MTNERTEYKCIDASDQFFFPIYVNRICNSILGRIKIHPASVGLNDSQLAITIVKVGPVPRIEVGNNENEKSLINYNKSKEKEL